MATMEFTSLAAALNYVAGLGSGTPVSLYAPGYLTRSSVSPSMKGGGGEGGAAVDSDTLRAQGYLSPKGGKDIAVKTASGVRMYGFRNLGPSMSAGTALSSWGRETLISNLNEKFTAVTRVYVHVPEGY